jgi:hypothetical protein
MTEQGIVNLEGMLRMLAPGFPDQTTRLSEAAPFVRAIG